MKFSNFLLTKRLKLSKHSKSNRNIIHYVFCWSSGIRILFYCFTLFSFLINIFFSLETTLKNTYFVLFCFFPLFISTTSWNVFLLFLLHDVAAAACVVALALHICHIFFCSSRDLISFIAFYFLQYGSIFPFAKMVLFSFFCVIMRARLCSICFCFVVFLAEIYLRMAEEEQWLDLFFILFFYVFFTSSPACVFVSLLFWVKRIFATYWCDDLCLLFFSVGQLVSLSVVVVCVCVDK